MGRTPAGTTWGPGRSRKGWVRSSPKRFPREGLGRFPPDPGPCPVVSRSACAAALCHRLSGCVAWPLCASVLSPEEQKAHLG